MRATDSADVMKRVAGGDTAAFAQIYRTYLPLVLRWCLRGTGERELAEDLSSEVFAEAVDCGGAPSCNPSGTDSGI